MVTSPAELPPPLRLIRVDEYHRMIDVGILGEDEHVQLVDGLLVAMSPQGRLHAFIIQKLNRILARSLPEEFELLTQLPLTLEDDSEPEPDLAVVSARDASSRTEHPNTAVLVIEVAGDSLAFDRRSKAALYARAGIPEYWIVNLHEATVEVGRDPDPPAGRYRETFVARRGEVLLAAAVSEIRVDLGVLFPAP